VSWLPTTKVNTESADFFSAHLVTHYFAHPPKKFVTERLVSVSARALNSHLWGSNNHNQLSKSPSEIVSIVTGFPFAVRPSIATDPRFQVRSRTGLLFSHDSNIAADRTRFVLI
jgi:hypothetical protein